MGNEGSSLTHTLELESRAGRPFEIERADDPAGLVQAAVFPCAQERPDCAALGLTVDDPVKGSLNGTILVYVKGVEEPIPLTFSGIVVGAETVVKKVELREEPPGAQPWPPDAAQEGTGQPVDKAPHAESPAGSGQAAVSPPGEGPQGGSPTALPPASAALPRQAVLKWVTRHDAEVYGYLVYRSTRREGPFTRVNARIVPAAGGEGEEHAYVFVDRDVEESTAYFYYLDLVTRGGSKKRFSGVVEKRIPQVKSDGAAGKPTAS